MRSPVERAILDVLLKKNASLETLEKETNYRLASIRKALTRLRRKYKLISVGYPNNYVLELWDGRVAELNDHS